MPTYATYGRTITALDADALTALLAARPDLAAPPPSSLRSLAARATGRPSLEAALAGLTTAELAVVESVVALEPLDDEAAVGRLDAEILARLEPRALVWRDDDERLRAAPGLAEVLGPYPAGLGPHTPESETAAARLPDLLGEAPPGAREVLDALTWGPPVGVRPTTGPGATATAWLLERSLLLDADEHVVLPRAVGLALRGGRVHRAETIGPPDFDDETTGRTTTGRAAAPAVDTRSVAAESARAATDVVRWVATTLGAWGSEPPDILRSGGLGVRELRRLARSLDIHETDAASMLEIALAAGLIATDEEMLAPTTLADDWLDLETPERWAALVSAWQTSPRTGWLVGTRDARGALRSVLDPDLQRAWVPELRRRVLGVLETLTGRRPTPEAVLDVLRWYRPRTTPPDQGVRGILHEAALLGVTGAGALSPAAAPLLAENSGGSVTLPARLAEALRGVLPEPVDEVLLQGDLTGIVPGTPTSGLAALLDAASDVESRGSATTVRFSGASVARALDDRSADELLAELSARSPVPVPQPLEYLVRDAARRHGSLRVGDASSYIRSDDAGTLAALAEDPALAHLGVRLIAPTVLVASAPGPEVHAALRAAGLSPVVEGPDGSIVQLAETRRRSRARVRPAWVAPGRGHRPVRPDPRLAESVDETPAQRSERARRVATRLLARAQAGAEPLDDGTEPHDSPAEHAAAYTNDSGGTPHRVVGSGGSSGGDSGDGSGNRTLTEPGDVVALLHEAVAEKLEVDVELIGSRGLPEVRRLSPRRLDGGRLRAIDTAREAEITVAVHRIASVRAV